MLIVHRWFKGVSETATSHSVVWMRDTKSGQQKDALNTWCIIMNNLPSRTDRLLASTLRLMALVGAGAAPSHSTAWCLCSWSWIRSFFSFLKFFGAVHTTWKKKWHKRAAASFAWRNLTAFHPRSRTLCFLLLTTARRRRTGTHAWYCLLRKSWSPEQFNNTRRPPRGNNALSIMISTTSVSMFVGRLGKQKN